MRLAVGIIAAVLVGLLVGRISAPASSSSVPVEASPSPGPTGESVGVGVGFSRTPKGAAVAAASYQRAFADKAILRPGELRRRIEVVATPDYVPALLEANRPGTDRLRSSGFGEGIRGQVTSAFFGVPVAYRILSFSGRRAVVQTWGFTLLGNLAGVEPTALFGLARTVLTWDGGDWKIADTRASFGPTPRLAAARPSAEGLSLVELTEELHSYGVAP